MVLFLVSLSKMFWRFIYRWRENSLHWVTSFTFNVIRSMICSDHCRWEVVFRMNWSAFFFWAAYNFCWVCADDGCSTFYSMRNYIACLSWDLNLLYGASLVDSCPEKKRVYCVNGEGANSCLGSGWLWCFRLMFLRFWLLRNGIWEDLSVKFCWRSFGLLKWWW